MIKQYTLSLMLLSMAGASASAYTAGKLTPVIPAQDFISATMEETQAAPANMMLQTAPAIKLSVATTGKTGMKAASANWELLGTASFPEYFCQMMSMYMQNAGDTFVAGEQPFTIMRRTDPENADMEQWRFINVFNGVNMDLKYDTRTHLLTTDYIDTGIKCSYDESLDTYRITLTGIYYEQSHTINIRGVFLCVAEMDGTYSGYNPGSCGNMTFDGHSPEQLFFENPFVPASENTAKFRFESSDGIKTYRMVERDGINTLADLASYFSTPVQGDNKAYMDFAAGSQMSIDVTGKSPVISYYAIPLDQNGDIAIDYGVFHIYHNDVPAGQWQSIGTGKLRDYIYTHMLSNEAREEFRDRDYEAEYGLEDYQHAYKYPMAAQSVDIEVDASTPSRYRVKNPYGVNHPYSSLIAGNKTDSDDFYLIIDASDPGNVIVENRLLLNADYMTVFGASGGELTADRRIVMPSGSLSSVYWSTVMPEADLILELPDYKEYTLSFASPEITVADGQYSIAVNFSSNITALDYTLISDQTAASIPATTLAQMIADKDKALENPVRHIATDASGSALLSFADAEVPMGKNRIAAIGRLADGTQIGLIVTENNIVKYRPLNEWTAGTARVNELLMLAPSTSQQMLTFDVETRENPDVPGEFVLVSYFSKAVDAIGMEHPEELPQVHMYIDATNPQNIVLSQPAELNWSLFNGCDNTTITQNQYNTGSRYTNSLGADIIDLGYCMDINLHDSNGEYVGTWQCGTFTVTLNYDESKDPDNIKSWKSLGMAEITENILVNDLNQTPVTFNTEVFESPLTPHIYALVNPYSDWDKVSHTPAGASDSGEHIMYINATNPDAVNLSFSANGALDLPTLWYEPGIHHEDASRWLFYLANLIVNGRWNPDTPYTDYLGTKDDDLIVLDNCLAYTYHTDQYNIHFPVNPCFRIKLPDGAGVEAVGADNTDAPVEYFNLQGIKVADPRGGIFIRRQGSECTKVAIP